MRCCEGKSTSCNGNKWVFKDQFDKLATLVILLCKWNNALNLTAIRDPNDMVVLHILDSAVLSPLIKDKGNNIADVGTGAGFPGLVLAILNPEIQFTEDETEIIFMNETILKGLYRSNI